MSAMKRYKHYWWTLKGARFPSRIAILDCDSGPRLDSAAAGSGSRQLTAWALSSVALKGGEPANTSRVRGDCETTAWDAISQLLTSKDRTWLFCADTGTILPLLSFWQRLENKWLELEGKDFRSEGAEGAEGEEWTSGLCIDEDPPTVILCRRPQYPGKLLLLDIRNWGIELLPDGEGCHDRARQYLSGICDCLRSLRQVGRISVRCTAGSQAVCALRTNHDCVRLHCHTHRMATEVERSAYFGGRCEAFRLGEVAGEVYHLDVRNMYPALCCTLPVPVSLRRYHATERDSRSAVDASAESCIAHVRVRDKLNRWPYRRRDEIVYPVGEYDTYLCGPELRRAVDCGAVAQVYRAAEYVCSPALGTFYHSWLGRLHDARFAGRTMEQQWIKRVMNALVGKFGEPGRRWVAAGRRTDMEPYDRWYQRDNNGEFVRYRNLAWFTQREEISGESYWSMPAIAGWITSAGRCRLWDYLATAGGENVWYVDTDSLLTNRTGFDRLLSRGFVREGTPGYLRLIGQDSRCAIYGIRHYLFGDTVTCAGVPRGRIEPGETRGQYFLRVSPRDETAVGLRPSGSREQLFYPGATEYRHGRVMPDGSVQPWEVNGGKAR